MTINSFSRFTKDRLAHYSFTPLTKELLRVLGLPTYSSPGLYFGDFEGVSLPRLNDWPWLKSTPPKEYSDYIVIGEGGNNDNRPICIKEENESIFILDQDKAFECIFMNSSVLQLAAALTSHQAMVSEAMFTSGDDVYGENRIPKTLIKAFEEKLNELDTSALATGAFWANEIIGLKEGLQKFEGLKKYQFELFGQMCEEGESFRLRTVTVAADVPVIRAIAEFLSQCADGIEKHGHKWNHEHFLNDWLEWYSAYPDIVVVQTH